MFECLPKIDSFAWMFMDQDRLNLILLDALYIIRKEHICQCIRIMPGVQLAAQAAVSRR